MTFRPTLAAALTIAALGLAGCSSVPFTGKPVVLPCPKYYILEDAATLTQFKDGPGRDLTDVAYRTEMKEVTLGCLTDVERETMTGTMDIDIAPVIGAELGPAFNQDTAQVPYFVVITNPDKEILYREELSMEISFKGNQTRLVAIAPRITLEIPITPATNDKYYKIYSGFVLTEEQLAFNRKAIQDRLR